MAANKVEKETNDSNSSSIDGSAYEGRRISREFERNAYHGTVDGYDPRRALWHVAYDDGDAEELDRGELLLALDLFRRGGIAGGGEGENACGASYVGRRVSKKFGREIYHGTVDGFVDDGAGGGRLWHVAYDDGDAEEFDRGELLFAVDLFDRVNCSNATPPRPKGMGPLRNEDAAARKVCTNDRPLSPKAKKDPVDLFDRINYSNATPPRPKGMEPQTNEDAAARKVSTDDGPLSPKAKKDPSWSPTKNNQKISFAIPVIVAAISIAIWLCKYDTSTAYAAAAGNRED